MAYERSGRADRAIADYRRALHLMPSSRMDREAQENARQRIVALANGPAAPAVPVPASPPGRRIALVIGMSAYANVGQLRNPASDARSIADAFRRLGFADVIEREDLTRAGAGDFDGRAAWRVVGSNLHARTQPWPRGHYWGSRLRQDRPRRRPRRGL
jgi:hypothetical protein